MIFYNWDLWEKIISQIQSSITRQVFKDHMTIDKVTDNEVSLIHDNNMIAKTMLEKEHKEIEALLEKELGKKVTLNIQWMTREEYYFLRVIWIDNENWNEELCRNTGYKTWKNQDNPEEYKYDKNEKENILKLFFFDTETTWRDRRKHYIIQFWWIVWELNTKTFEFKEITRINQFINPPINEDDFDKKAIETHHIHKRDLVWYLDITWYIHDFLKLIEDADYVIGHNVDFDKNFLIWECKRNKIEFDDSEVKWIDTMKPSKEIVKALDKRWRIKNPRLIELYTYLFWKWFDWAHDAMADITATKDCFIELIKKYWLFREILNKDRKRASYQVTRIEDKDNYDPFDKIDIWKKIKSNCSSLDRHIDRNILIRSVLGEIESYSKTLDTIESDIIKGIKLIKFRNWYIHDLTEKVKHLEMKRSIYKIKGDVRNTAFYTEEIFTLINKWFDKLKEINEVISLNTSIIRNYYENEDKLIKLFENFLKKYHTELEEDSIEENSDINHNINTKEDEDLIDGNNFAITSENLSFSKMKVLLEIILRNPWNIIIQVMWNEEKVSKEWLKQLKKLIEE